MKIGFCLFGLLRHTDIEKAKKNFKNILNNIGKKHDIEPYICIPKIKNEFAETEVENDIFKIDNLNENFYDYSAEEIIKICKDNKLPIIYSIYNFYSYRVLSYFLGIKKSYELMKKNNYDLCIMSRIDHIEKLTINLKLLNSVTENNCPILRQHDFRVNKIESPNDVVNAEDRGFIVTLKQLEILSKIYDKFISKKIPINDYYCSPERIIYKELIDNNINLVVGSACSGDQEGRCHFPAEVAHIHPTHPRGPGCNLNSCLFRFEGVTVNGEKYSRELYKKVSSIYYK